jgi:hypothetical protein
VVRHEAHHRWRGAVVRAEVADFRFWPCLAARLSRRVGGFHGPGCSPSWPSGCPGWSAGWESLQPGGCDSAVGGPGPALGEAKPQPLGFPAAGRPGQGDHQPGLLGAPDAVLAPCPPPVPQLQVSQLAAPGAGGEAGEPPRPRPRPSADTGTPAARALFFTWKVASARDGQDSRQAQSSQFKGTFHADERPGIIPGESPRSVRRAAPTSVWGSRQSYAVDDRGSRHHVVNSRSRALIDVTCVLDGIGRSR